MATKPWQVASVSNPQQMFESALSVVQHNRPRRGSIAARTQPIARPHSEQQEEKRALTDAARALATLWKVSPHLVR
ncbi:MAG TPA: hypothetical protein VJQ54_19390 [Candidatus Sulfotelmatobacter sp.]|nr:hypothetical protein [Candidatus Sulfotelmatobacter sp.]